MIGPRKLTSICVSIADVGLFEKRAGRHDAGVVDEHVDRPDFLLDRLDEVRERVAVGHVELECHGRADRSAAAASIGRLLVEVADHDDRAAGGEVLGRLQADSAGAAGDRDDCADQ